MIKWKSGTGFPLLARVDFFHGFGKLLWMQCPVELRFWTEAHTVCSVFNGLAAAFFSDNQTQSVITQQN
jgi:hypothetical protein